MENSDKLRLIIFSDLHYAPELPVNNGSNIDRKLIQYSIPLINQLIQNINYSLKPDIVVNLGDLIEDFNNHDRDVENLTFIWNVLKNIKEPFYSLAGNHDLRTMETREEVENIMGYKHSTFSINLKKHHLVFLGLDVNNKMSVEEGGILKTQFISNEDLQWLKKDLRQNKFPCLVFCHFGIAEDEMKGNWWFENCPECALLGNRKELKKILTQDKNLIGVFSGHQHWTKHLIEDDIHYYVVGSLTENINNDGIPDGVYFEVEIDNKRLNIKEKHLVL